MTLANLINALKRNKAAIEDEIGRQQPSATAQSIGEQYGYTVIGAGYFTLGTADIKGYRSSFVMLKGQCAAQELYRLPSYRDTKPYSIFDIDTRWNNDWSESVRVVVSDESPVALIGQEVLGVMLDVKDKDMDALEYIAKHCGIEEFPSAFREFVRNLEALDDIKPHR